MDICNIPNIFKRDDIVSTAESFKSWDTCMDNKVCKIIAIVGICLASLTALWLLGAVLTCFRQGVTGIAEFICWCCQCNKRSQPPPMNDNYMQNRPAMPPSTVIYQPIKPPQSAYYRNDKEEYYDENVSKDVYELEQDFDLEKQKMRSKATQLNSNSRNQSPVRLPATTYDNSNGNNSIGTIPGAFSSRDAFMRNSNFSSEFVNPSQEQFDQYDPYGAVLNNNTNGYNYGNNYQPNPQHRTPYPEDGTQTRYNYYYNNRY